ncbi:helix-turn-helix domain-containing protein [Ruegeria sp. HKCCA6948]|uniref:helix-turn-helix domain-containing protein n=1 Tax=unclassified Ruegeria TaxID=2625375 RepID=UPI00353031E6
MTGFTSIRVERGSTITAQNADFNFNAAFEVGAGGQSALAALLHLDRVSAWDTRTRDATTDLSGRTPPRLIEVLTASPMVSAPLAERLTEASRAAVQRNLILFTERGLIREVTGQGRYRVWTAAL